MPADKTGAGPAEAKVGAFPSRDEILSRLAPELEKEPDGYKEYKRREDYKLIDPVIELMQVASIGLEQVFSEIKDLNQEQIIALSKLYSRGLKGQHLRAWNPCSKKIDDDFKYNHKDTIIYLITVVGLTPEQAVREINALNGRQADVLKTFYLEGLRGDHLRNWEACEGEKNSFTYLHKPALTYLIRKAQLTPEQAVREINRLNYLQAGLLFKFHKKGLSGDHLRAWKPFCNAKDKFFTQAHRDVVVYLINDIHLTPEKAIQEINELSEAQAELLLEFYVKGLRGNQLRKWQPHDNVPGVFCSTHQKVMIYLISVGLNFDQAIQELAMLNIYEAQALQECYVKGLRNNHLRNRFYLEPASKALSYLIHIRDLKPEEAIQHLSKLSSRQIHDLDDLYQENIRTIKNAMKTPQVAKEEKTSANTPSADIDRAGSKMPPNVSSLVAAVCDDSPAFAARAAEVRTPNVSAIPVLPSPTPK